MAITSQDTLVAALGGAQRLIVNKANVTAVAGRCLSLWSAAGQPGVGSVALGQAAAGAVSTSADLGALGFTNPVSQNSYLARIAGIGQATGLLVVYDLLWLWGSGGSGWSVTTTTAQSTTSPAALTRPDANGTNTELWMETLAVGGNASGTSVISYTNSAGTASRTANLLTTKVNTPPIGTIEKYALQAGDNGVKSIQSMTNNTTWTSGTFRLMIVRRIAEVPINANVGFNYDAYDLGLPRVYDSASIGLAFEANSTTTGPISASLHLAQG
jgi:hypothetical protein